MMKTTHERWQEHMATLEDIKPLVNGMTADEPGALLLKLLVIIADIAALCLLLSIKRHA
jgi:hypothetical protein